ncbi:MAG: DUF192 domain-containing protein [Pikeienuella sp.]
MGKYTNRSCFLALIFLSITSITGIAAACPSDQVEIRTQDGIARFSVEVADTYESRAQGLMHRTEMPDDHGMFFVYPVAERITFWMKNTPMSLDIIFVSRQGTICSIAPGTTPFSTDHIPSGCAAQTVLEVKAGIAAAAGVRVGAPIRHPAILNPFWTCE